MSDCCMIYCCIKDGCKCRERRDFFKCCVNEKIKFFGVTLDIKKSCHKPGGCKTDTFDCGHECCNIKPWGCCNPCYKPDGCMVELHPNSFKCHQGQLEWNMLFNQ